MRVGLTSVLLLLSTILSFPVISQDKDRGKEGPSKTEIALSRERGLSMLDDIKQALKERYYDKNFRGINVDERFKAAKERIKKLETNAQIFRAIAQVVLEFDDSHTLFVPPSRINRIVYGFSVQMIGNDCYVIDVTPGSDAERKGLRTGDRVVGLDKYIPSRQILWKMMYLLYSLDPQTIIKMRVVDPAGAVRDLEINASFTTWEERRREADKAKREKSEDPYRCQKINSETIACKLRTFSVEKKVIDKMRKEIGESKKLILDLRGNSGGYVSVEEYLTGHFFDHDIKIATFVTRDKAKDRVAKSQKGKVFNGDLIVLIDSNSASASEVFARVIQMEKRGRIIGDTSAGAVMTGNFIRMQNERGDEEDATYSFFGLNVTVADLLMSDGKRLEKVGVVPDQLAKPTANALREKLDPVLAFASSELGVKLSAGEAANFHFLMKRTEADNDGNTESANDD